MLLMCLVPAINICLLQQYTHPASSLFEQILNQSTVDSQAEARDARKQFKDTGSPIIEELQHQNRNLTGYNVLLLYADDWSHHTLSSYHKTKPLNSILMTPNLDKLASEGIRFTHNCVTTSICWISRATLYTGQYLSRHKTSRSCCWNGMKKSASKVDTPQNWKELSPYELLAANGYYVGHVGKWGISLPFDKKVHYNVEEDGWHFRTIGNKLWHITEKNEADALKFLAERPRDRAFFLNVAFFATHAVDSDKMQYMPQKESMSMYANDTIPIPPTGTDEAWRKMPYFFNENNYGRIRWHWRYENYSQHQFMMKNYYRMATEVDSAIGTIVDELKRQSEFDNTVIIFTTDNGNFHSEHGLADKWLVLDTLNMVSCHLVIILISFCTGILTKRAFVFLSLSETLG